MIAENYHQALTKLPKADGIFNYKNNSDIVFI